MKKIVNGRVYDTEAAELIASWSYGDGPSDFHWYEEGLYRKGNGEFFLAGEGGAMSSYAEQVSTHSWRGGSSVTPLTESDARELAESHLDADDYIELFGAEE